VSKRGDPDAPLPRATQRSEASQIRGRLLEDALAEAGFGNPQLGDAKPEAWANLLGDVPLFAELGKRHLRRIAKTAKVARVSAGQVVVREGFSAEAFYVLLTGQATVHRGGIDIAELHRGDYFGELGLLDGAPRTASVLASTDLWAVRLPRDRFLALLDDEPSITRGILATLVERLRRLESERAR
jgi:CRP/FNR family transcriptional regulator, cyclic AMP receptor protein